MLHVAVHIKGIVVVVGGQVFSQSFTCTLTCMHVLNNHKFVYMSVSVCLHKMLAVLE